MGGVPTVWDEKGDQVSGAKTRKHFTIHKQHDSNRFRLEIKGIPFPCSREEVPCLQTLLAAILRENPDSDETLSLWL